MSVLLSLVSFLLVMVAGGGPHAHLATAEDTVVPNSANQVIAYWQTVLPNSPMPSAVLELLDPLAGDNEIGEDNTGNNPVSRLLFYKYGRAKHNTDNNPASRQIPLFYSYGRAKHNTGNNPVSRFFFYKYGRAKHSTDNNPASRQIPFFYSYGRAKYNTDNNPASKLLPFFYSYGRAKHNTGNDPAARRYIHYGKATKGASEKSPAAVNEDDQNSIHDIQKSTTNTHGGGHEHVHGDGDGQVANESRGLFFFEDELVPGSMVTARVLPTNPHRSKLLNREIADSIPFSSKDFTRIITMFAPESVAMADDIKSTLEFCEDPDHLKGEKRGCATSVESLVELATSILETPDIRAFSSDVPMEGMPAQQYKLNAVRKVSDSLKIMTCHDMTYPYMVFFCHMTYPSRAYLVTLASDDGSPAREALAMCHLDTSSWDPSHIFFQLKHVKPGETTACHFLNRGAILWVPGGNQEPQAAA